MTVRASIHVLHVSRVYGRTIGHRTTNCNLPFSSHHSTPTLPPPLPRPEDPMSFRLLKKTIAQTSAWRLRGHPHDAHPKRFKCFKKPKTKIVNEEIQDKTIKHIIAKKLPSYLMPAFLPPSRLVVASRTNSVVSFVPSSGLHGSWHTKVLFLAIQRSDSTRTHSPSGSITMHRDAWPTPPTYLRTSTSSTTRGR